jgi:hypothetical protein
MTQPAAPDAARLRITLHDLDPAPWRTVEVPLSMTFKGLHDTIQAAFGWFDSHLWEFDYGDRRYGLPFDDDFGSDKIHNAATARLTKLRDGQVSAFLYTYDMGDNWEHHIEVIELFDMEKGARLPRFVDGRWRTPPEDVGGPPGFEMFLHAIADPAHEEHDHLLDWNGGPFDREDIERDIVTIQMGRLANMRRPKA